MNAEQRAVFQSKPLHRMQYFASMLNWHGLQLKCILFSGEEVAMWNVPENGIICFYLTTDEKFNLQINEIPSGQSRFHQATIKAERYGIRDIGWHPFILHEGDDELRIEAERLRPWLDRVHYKKPIWLRQLKVWHPDMVLRTSKKQRGRPKQN